MKTMTVLAWPILAALALAGCTPAGALIGGSAVVARSVVQERSTFAALTDVEIELSILTRLGARSGELFRDVSVDVVEGRVLLAGSVPRREDRVAADEIAWAVSGVAAVANEIVVAEDTGTRAYIADAGISNRLRYELLIDGSIRSVNYNVETVDRVVFLTGIAVSQGELERAVRKAQSIEGVREVVSHVLLIDDPRRQQIDSADAGARPAPAASAEPAGSVDGAAAPIATAPRGDSAAVTESAPLPPV